MRRASRVPSRNVEAIKYSKDKGSGGGEANSYHLNGAVRVVNQGAMSRAAELRKSTAKCVVRR